MVPVLFDGKRKEKKVEDKQCKQPSSMTSLKLYLIVANSSNARQGFYAVRCKRPVTRATMYMFIYGA